jgi:hypothetical protein
MFGGVIGSQSNIDAETLCVPVSKGYIEWNTGSYSVPCWVGTDSHPEVPDEIDLQNLSWNGM